jgi:hypothetical protein
MEPSQLLETLLELADSVGLAVQRVGRQPAFEGLSPSSSGTCKVRGKVRVLLADSDPLEARISVLARALREDAGEALEERFLPPAVRACLEAAAPDGEPRPA